MRGGEEPEDRRQRPIDLKQFGATAKPVYGPPAPKQQHQWRDRPDGPVRERTLDERAGVNPNPMWASDYASNMLKRNVQSAKDLPGEIAQAMGYTGPGLLNEGNNILNTAAEYYSPTPIKFDRDPERWNMDEVRKSWRDGNEILGRTYTPPQRANGRDATYGSILTPQIDRSRPRTQETWAEVARGLSAAERAGAVANRELFGQGKGWRESDAEIYAEQQGGYGGQREARQQRAADPKTSIPRRFGDYLVGMTDTGAPATAEQVRQVYHASGGGATGVAAVRERFPEINNISEMINPATLAGGWLGGTLRSAQTAGWGQRLTNAAGIGVEAVIDPGDQVVGAAGDILGRGARAAWNSPVRHAATDPLSGALSKAARFPVRRERIYGPLQEPAQRWWDRRESILNSPRLAAAREMAGANRMEGIRRGIQSSREAVGRWNDRVQAGRNAPTPAPDPRNKLIMRDGKAVFPGQNNPPRGGLPSEPNAEVPEIRQQRVYEDTGEASGQYTGRLEGVADIEGQHVAGQSGQRIGPDVWQQNDAFGRYLAEQGYVLDTAADVNVPERTSATIRRNEEFTQPGEVGVPIRRQVRGELTNDDWLRMYDQFLISAHGVDPARTGTMGNVSNFGDTNLYAQLVKARLAKVDQRITDALSTKNDAVWYSANQDILNFAKMLEDTGMARGQKVRQQLQELKARLGPDPEIRGRTGVNPEETAHEIGAELDPNVERAVAAQQVGESTDWHGIRPEIPMERPTGVYSTAHQRPSEQGGMDLRSLTPEERERAEAAQVAYNIAVERALREGTELPEYGGALDAYGPQTKERAFREPPTPPLGGNMLDGVRPAATAYQQAAASPAGRRSQAWIGYLENERSLLYRNLQRAFQDARQQGYDVTYEEVVRQFPDVGYELDQIEKNLQHVQGILESVTAGKQTPEMAAEHLRGLREEAADLTKQARVFFAQAEAEFPRSRVDQPMPIDWDRYGKELMDRIDELEREIDIRGKDEVRGAADDAELQPINRELGAAQQKLAALQEQFNAAMDQRLTAVSSCGHAVAAVTGRCIKAQCAVDTRAGSA